MRRLATLWTKRAGRSSARLPLWRTLVVLIVAGFGALALLMRPGERPASSLPPGLAEEPDLYLEDGIVTQYRADGSLDYRLAAERISQFEQPRQPGDRLAVLVQPRLALYREDAPTWQVRAAEGTLRQAPPASGSEERVELRGDVRLVQSGGDGDGQGDAREVRTEALNVYPARQRASTDRPVVLLAAVGRASAAGLEADLASGQMTLRSAAGQRVSIVVDPPAARPAGG